MVCAFRYTDWTGARRLKKKEGFALRREAQEYERQFLLKNSQSCDMSFASLVELYQEDADHRVRDTTRGAQDNIINRWLLPYFGQLPVDKIDAVTIRKWQNELLSKTNPKTGKPYAPTYLRSINSRLSAIMNYAVMYYGLRQNPCLPAGFMGKKKAGRMKFWTLAEFEAALAEVKKPAFPGGFPAHVLARPPCGRVPGIDAGRHPAVEGGAHRQDAPPQKRGGRSGPH